MATATAHPKFNLISSEHLVGAKVYDPGGKEIGEIDHLMIDKISGHAVTL
jgi:sporulation protein YlmC with PRC-barrel domain